MRADPIGRRFGYGASHFRVAAEGLAPVEPVSPFAGAGSAAATVVVSGVIVFAGLRALHDDDVDSSALRIVPMQAQVVEPEPAPEPIPEPEPEPEPVVVAEPEPPPPPPPKPLPKPEPVVVAKAEPPKPKPIPKPEPIRAPAPKLEPPRPLPKPEPVAKPARRAPMPMIDAPRAPQPTETEKQTAWRPPAVKTPKMPSAPALPRVAIDGVAGTPDAAPQKPNRVSSLPPGVAGPKRAAAPAIPRVAPPSAVAPTLPGDEPVADLPSRAEPSAPKQERAARPAPSRPVAFAGAASASATHTPMESASAMRERVAAAPVPSAAARAEPDQKLGGVPLSAFPACRTDQREDTLKLAVLAAVGKQRECSSGAGKFRFVETKNLNSFLLWIERAPGRAAADRCGELTHALNCLSRSGAK